ncbi:hypothetical protein [Thermococcus sp.]|nr:hypothetical protein [Thermococcus sp.]
MHVDYKKCAVTFSRTFGCLVCVKECTFTKSDYDRIKRAYEKIFHTQKRI